MRWRASASGWRRTESGHDQHDEDSKGHTAVIGFDPDLGRFRGEFVGLNGGADFYAESVEALRKEGKRSLETFLEVCRERGIDPQRKFSGTFVVSLPGPLHERVASAASAAGVSLRERR